MSLADDLANTPLPTPPAKYQKHAELDYETGKGEAATGAVRGDTAGPRGNAAAMKAAVTRV